MRILLSFVFLFSVSFANASDVMTYFSEQTNGSSFDGNYLPKNFTATEVKFVKWSPELVTQLFTMEAESTEKWIEFVDSSGEFDYMSAEEVEAIKKDPAGYFDDKYLTQIRAQYAIYKDGVLVGYVVDIIDHVQSAIYQDGAGTVIYLDVDLKIVSIDEWAS